MKNGVKCEMELNVEGDVNLNDLRGKKNTQKKPDPRVMDQMASLL